MIDLSAPRYDRKSFAEMSPRKVFIISAVLHVVLLIGLPLMGKLFFKPKKFERPHTFELVQAPIPPAAKRRTPTPPKPDPTPEPTPPKPDPLPEPTPKPKPDPTPKPTPTQKPVEQPKPSPPKEEPIVKEVDVLDDDLVSLLDKPLAVVVSAPGKPPHPYLRGVHDKIKRNWRPAKRSASLYAEVVFTIHGDGSISGIRISRSSGDSQIDRAAMDAVERCQTFGNLPPGWGDRIEINCTLRPTEG